MVRITEPGKAKSRQTLFDGIKQQYEQAKDIASGISDWLTGGSNNGDSNNGGNGGTNGGNNNGGNNNGGNNNGGNQNGGSGNGGNDNGYWSSVTG